MTDAERLEKALNTLMAIAMMDVFTAEDDPVEPHEVMRKLAKDCLAKLEKGED